MKPTPRCDAKAEELLAENASETLRLAKFIFLAIALETELKAESEATAQLREALTETNARLAELIKDEFDDKSVGITGWNSLHELVAANNKLLNAPTAGAK